MSRNKGVAHVYITRSLREEARKKARLTLSFTLKLSNNLKSHKMERSDQMIVMPITPGKREWYRTGKVFTVYLILCGGIRSKLDC